PPASEPEAARVRSTAGVAARAVTRRRVTCVVICVIPSGLWAPLGVPAGSGRRPAWGARSVVGGPDLLGAGDGGAVPERGGDAVEVDGEDDDGQPRLDAEPDAQTGEARDDVLAQAGGADHRGDDDRRQREHDAR